MKRYEEKPFFPMFIDLSKKKVVVIGGGRIAGRRIRTLLSFAGQICVIAPEVTEEIEGYIKEGMVTHLKTRYAPELIRDADLVLAATDDPACNEQAADECRRRGIPVNVSPQKGIVRFLFPGNRGVRGSDSRSHSQRAGPWEGEKSPGGNRKDINKTRGRDKSMMSRKIRIGSRKSRLAVIQTELVMDTIRETHPEIELELITMETTGDRRLDVTLDKIGGKGLFVKELDRALLEGRIDLAVHSLKDMPMEESSRIPILGYTKREDVGMCWCCRKEESPGRAGA